MLQSELLWLDEVAKFEAVNGSLFFDKRELVVERKNGGTIGLGALGRAYCSGLDFLDHATAVAGDLAGINGSIALVRL
ncbi:MAG: hypothetical protein JZU63_00955 [Rhodoferax sp.]|nr:hypothetical protein [Rhodoferax sp.]